MKLSKWLIILVLTTGILVISTSATLIRLASQSAFRSGVEFSLVIAASRVAIASLLLVPTWPKIKWKNLPPGAIIYGAAAGVCLAAHFALWTTSLSYTSIAASTTLVTTNPIWVAFLSWWCLKERLSRQTIIGIVVAMAGGLMIGLADIGGTTPGSNSLLGNFLALMGAWTSSLYIFLGYRARTKGFSIGGYIVVVYTIAAILLLPIPFIFGVGYSGHSGSVYFYLLLIGLLPQLIGHTSINWAMGWVSPTFITLAVLFEPVGASFLGYLFFGEAPSLIILLGIVILLIGVAVAALGSPQK